MCFKVKQSPVFDILLNFVFHIQPYAIYLLNICIWLHGFWWLHLVPHQKPFFLRKWVDKINQSLTFITFFLVESRNNEDKKCAIDKF